MLKYYLHEKWIFIRAKAEVRGCICARQIKQFLGIYEDWSKKLPFAIKLRTDGLNMDVSSLHEDWIFGRV